MSLTADLHLLLPEFVLAGLALVVLAVDLVLPASRKLLLGWLSVAGLGGLIALSLVLLWGEDQAMYGGLVQVDAYSLFFKCFFMAMGIFIILSSMDYIEKYLTHPGEYYGLILFSVLAMSVMAASRELLTAYIALELMSFCFYILASYAMTNAKSNEAGIKYVLIGAFSSAILLFGVSLLYSSIGVTTYDGIHGVLAAGGEFSPALWVGIALILVGLGFKMAAVPFHMWAPDVYEGAPLPVTAYLAVGSKAAAFALVLRLFAEAFIPTVDDWQIIVAVLAAVTMTVGNLVAIAQRNIKRLLAYSSVGQVGFLLLGIAALPNLEAPGPVSALASNGIMLHLVGYATTNMVVFVGVIAFFNLTGKEEIADFAGLADRHPFLAASIAVGLFSLAGLPFFAGFTTKFYLFTAAANEGLLWLASLAILNSLISLYYYLVVIRHMYIQPVPEEAQAAGDAAPGAEASAAVADSARLSPTPLILGVLAVLVLGTFFVGVYPFPIVEALDAATASILPIN
ncbi:MAG: NADH-quinone oxidoreductase subunit N [Dehalococcoidia bacterium]|nr:NADH-quinone oxidoreductase subunit N [Dehalococcoidia bacterium]